MWRKRLAWWKANGLKVGAICEREGVAPTALARWRKEVAARDARAANAAQATDAEAVRVCREIARAIEQQLDYPGEIKVTVIRESRSVEVAK